MSKNYDYKLICASNAFDFENQITKYLNEGYKLEGTRTVNISIAEKVFYTQAMIKEDSKVNAVELKEAVVNTWRNAWRKRWNIK